MSDSFGYPSKEECCICGSYKNNQSEPRYSYTVCEDHQLIPPAYISSVKFAYEIGLIAMISFMGKDYIFYPDEQSSDTK